MRLAAIYIEEHEFITDKPITINFGAEYEYSFIQGTKTVFVSREKNIGFIPNFFNIDNSKSKVDLVTAIAGRNGIGKTTLLDVIRSYFATHRYGFPYSSSTAIVEVDGEELPKVLHSNKDVQFNDLTKLIHTETINEHSISLGFLNDKFVQTIFYSPHLDLKYNLNFDEIDAYDISVDKSIDQDLEDLANKNGNASGWSFSPKQELIFKNSQRQLMFLGSDKSKSFKEIHKLSLNDESLLVFRGHKSEDPWNTPTSFQPYLRKIKEKLEFEIKNWVDIRVFDKQHKVTNQVEVNKYLVKRYLLRDIISVIERQMEKRNTYLSEGKVTADRIILEDDTISAVDLFKLFIKNSDIEFNSYKRKAFDAKSTLLLIEILMEYIDEIDEVKNVENDRIAIESTKVLKVLGLHRDFLINLFSYYPKLKEDEKQELLFEKRNRIDGFIEYLPSSKKLSSGENALLNLFSRFHDFIQNRLDEQSKFFPSRKHYILLLDEADLAFHPAWKRKYVKTILTVFPDLFAGLKKRPSLQIVFTTHDPLTLSDIPKHNVILLDRDKDDNLIISDNRNKETFGANIHDLLADSFFLEDELIGEFAKDKIEETIKWINKHTSDTRSEKRIEVIDEEYEFHKKVISIIEEPVLRKKLIEMLYQVRPDNRFVERMIEKETSYLRHIMNEGL